MPSGPRPSRAASEVVGVLLRRAAADRAPAELDGAEALRPRRCGRAPASPAACRRRAARRRASSGGTRRSRAASTPARRARGRAGPTAPSRCPTRCGRPAAGPCCRRRPARPMRAMSLGPVERLPEHRVADRPADAVRHRADEGGDGRQRRRLALAPADMAAAATRTSSASWLPSASVVTTRHGEVEEVDGFDLHGGVTFLQVSAAVRVSLPDVDDGPRLKLDALVERIHGPRADRVAERRQVGRGRPGHVDVEVLLNPLVVHVVFGVRRLHDDQVEVVRVEAVGVVHRAVEQAQRLREHDHGEVVECEHGGRARRRGRSSSSPAASVRPRAA